MNQNTVINTFNESSLHQTLKNMYAIQNDGKTEVKGENFIYDVVSKDGTIIEIQTKNLSKLSAKLSSLLADEKKIKLVHPVVITKRIITTDSNNTILSNRKSPKKGSIYDLFKELTGIYSILLNKNFELEVLEISLIEKRLKTETKIQSKNNNRRFKKDWIKTNKKLDEILEIKSFKSKEDYLNLLPTSLPEKFSSKELKEALKEEYNLSKNAYNQANLILWTFSRMGLIIYMGKENRLNYYKINKDN